MDRRQFLVRGAVGTAAALVGGNLGRLIASPLPDAQSQFDLVAVRGAEPDAMFDAAMSAYGGMAKFVHKGQRVLVKPNIGWDVDVARAGNTHPMLVKRIIEHCYNAGAKEVFVFDHTCDNWTKTYSNSGIERAVKDAGGKIVSGATEGYYQEISIPKGKRLTTAKVHEQLLQSDVFINVPILKHHSSARLTIGMKNHMGVVWDRGFWHKNDLHQCIADFATYRKPDLTIVDAYNVLKQNGPRGVSLADVALTKAQIISTDPVAADVAATKLFGLDIPDVAYLNLAAEAGVGRKNLESLNIKRIKLG
jgi:uncharacterized protein (DUF362 family)